MTLAEAKKIYAAVKLIQNTEPKDKLAAVDKILFGISLVDLRIKVALADHEKALHKT